MKASVKRRTEAVAFDTPTASVDAYGGVEDGWTEQFSARAEFIYQRGREAEQAGHLTGTATFKVKLRSSAASRAVTTEYRMRDTRRSVSYNVREVDAVTDRHWVWIVVENGVAI